ncbi:universal stress protein (plasmid) [Haloferax prahovense]|uniref:universal stress protein n=1 Tax=Haloferax prahovense TaxID=381852 RepID=UPI003C7202B0
MYTVILPVDSDEERGKTAAEYLTTLPGSPTDVDVVVLTVLKDSDLIGGDGSYVHAEDLDDRDSMSRTNQSVTEFLRDEGIKATSRIEQGVPHETILRVADDVDADGIVIVRRDRSPVGKAIFGSVTQKVLLSAEQPVTVLQ